MKTPLFLTALALGLASSAPSQVSTVPAPPFPTNDWPRQARPPAPPRLPAIPASIQEPTNAPPRVALHYQPRESLAPKEIRPVPGGARADFGRLKVQFTTDAADARPVTITTPDNRTLACRASFLALYNVATGESLLLGQVTNSIGWIVPPSRVIYSNAFDSIRAHILYIYSATNPSLSQDIILEENPVLPDSFAPEDTRLEVWTAWFGAEPLSRHTQTILLRPASEGASAVSAPDETADWGLTKMVAGSAFGSETPQQRLPVARSWVQSEGGVRYLVETVDYLALKASLDALDRKTRSGSAGQVSPTRLDLMKSLASVSPPSKNPRPMLVGPVRRASVLECASPLALSDNPPQSQSARGLAHSKTLRSSDGLMEQPATLNPQPSTSSDLRQSASSVDKSHPAPTVVLDFILICSVPVPADAVSWWPAGGETNANDALDGNNGTLINGVTYDDGEVGQAFGFDGSSGYVEVPSSSGISPTGPFTIEGWINYDHLYGQYGSVIVAKGQDVEGPVDWALSVSSSHKLRPHLRIDGGAWNYFDCYTNLLSNTWYHAAMVYDGTNLIGCLNGADNGSLAVTGQVQSTEYPLRIGAYAPVNGYPGYSKAFFAGRIDELTFYSRALAQAEIEAIYNAGPAGKVNPNCVSPSSDATGWWAADGNPYDLAQTNVATLVNGVAFGSGVVGQAFSFDGTTNYAEVPSSPGLKFTGSFTVEGWINYDHLYGAYGSVICAKGEDAEAAVDWALAISSSCTLRPHVNTSESGWSYFDCDTELQPGAWYHVAMVYDAVNSNLTGYVNGQCDRSVPVSGDVQATDYSLRIGAYAPVNGEPGYSKCFFPGSIDELTVYNRALSDTEIAAIYSAGCAGKCKVDIDHDGLPDWWEMQHFGNLLQTAAGDPDGDGLSNLAEYQLGTSPTDADTDHDGLTDREELSIWVDANNPSLGYLNPLNPDTGNTGIPDGQKDSDHDGISNLGELRKYHSDPCSANTFNAYKTDAEYLFTARPYDLNTLARLDIEYVGEDLLGFTISGAPANAIYDLYFVNSILAQRWQWRRVYGGIQCDRTGHGACTLEEPDPSQGYFIILDARDDDNDGLSNGYEAWFRYSGRRTTVDYPDTDVDGMKDGWETAYGLDPTDSADPNGAAGNPDLDAYPNYSTSPPLGEYNQNPLFADPSYDPLKPYGSTTPGQKARPVVSVSTSSSQAVIPGGTATFTIHRSVGLGADMSQALKVYYSVGGAAAYGTDYSLNPAPDPNDHPRIFSATIDVGQADVTVTVTPTVGGVNQAGLQTVVVKLTPFGVASNPQTSDPQAWQYVVDLFHEGVTLGIWNGILINLEKDPQDHYLRIKPASDTSPLPLINVANSARGTIARIYTGTDPASDPSTIVAEYYSAPDGRGRNPSRTTVDRYGDVWTGNRDEGDADGGSTCEYGIVIGGTRCNSDGSANPDGDYLKPPFVYNTCVDRHGATVNDPPDGLIRTSRGSGLLLPWLNTGDADSLGGVSTAEDEAILRYLRVVPTFVRTIIVDPNNNLWVGSHDDFWNEFIDTGAGIQVTGRRLNFRSGGYGGVIDGYGAVWSSGVQLPSGLVRFLPGTSTPVLSGGPIRNTMYNYGITVDPSSGDVWQPLHSLNDPLKNSRYVMQFRADHCATTIPIGQSDNRGIVVDGHGNIWVGGSYDTIFHLTTSGASVGAIQMSFPPDAPTFTASEPIGVTIDSSGMVWAICRTSSGGNGYAMRIDPAKGGTPPGSDRPLGQIVEAVDMGTGTGPYNYSDMSGFVTLSTAQPSGVWDHLEDAGVADTLWTSLSMDATVPTGTRILIEVRGANTNTELPSWPFTPVGAGGVTPPGTTALPSGVKGRYLEVRANLVRNFGISETPELRSLSLQHAGAGCAIQITAHPRSVAVAPGANVDFGVAAQVPTGYTATYRWFKDGTELSDGGNISGAQSSTLHVGNVQHTAQHSDAGRYSVRVGTESGCTFQLESAPARLHLKGNPPDLTQDLPSSLSVVQGQNAILTAAASGGANPGETPVFYQWRFNSEPIAAASGSCGGSGCSISRTIAGQCANAGIYSVVFWNQYGQISTTNCELGISGHEPVTVSPPSVVVTSPNQGVTLTATTCLGDVNCVQWYLTKGGQKTAIPGANSLVYTLPATIDCGDIGTYTVSVADQGWNAYEASAEVIAGNTGATISMSGTTLHIVPDNIGTGTWSHQWYYSPDGAGFAPISGATADSLSLTPADTSGYYKATARRSDGTAVLIVYYEPFTPTVTVRATFSASLDVTYAAQASGSPWTYQWYFTPQSTSQEQPIASATGSQYTVPSVGCARKGTYRVQVNCDGGSAYASLGVQSEYAITFDTLHITPDNVGTDTWTYQWAVADGVAGPYIPLTEETGASLVLFVSHLNSANYYKCTASRSGATAFVIARHYTAYGRYDGPSVTLEDKSLANLDVTFTGGVAAGPWAFQWYFTPLNGTEQLIPDATSGQYTVPSVGCAQRGTYRVQAIDGCGQSFLYDSASQVGLDVVNCP